MSRFLDVWNTPEDHEGFAKHSKKTLQQEINRLFKAIEDKRHYEAHMTSIFILAIIEGVRVNLLNLPPDYPDDDDDDEPAQA